MYDAYDMYVAFAAGMAFTVASVWLVEKFLDWLDAKQEPGIDDNRHIQAERQRRSER